MGLSGSREMASKAQEIRPKPLGRRQQATFFPHSTGFPKGSHAGEVGARAPPRRTANAGPLAQRSGAAKHRSHSFIATG